MNKNVELIKEKPPRTDIKMKELISAMESLGFNYRNKGGSHVVFQHNRQKDLITVVPIPHGGSNCVKQCYIKNIQQMIELIEE